MKAVQFDRADVPTIAAFMASDSFIRGLLGPFGSGKSSGCIWDIVHRGLRQKPGPDGVRRTRWAVIRNTMPQLRDTTIKTVFQWFPPPQFGRWRVTEHDYIMNTLMAPEDVGQKGAKPAVIELMFRALDRPDHVKNLLSLDLTGAWVNEAREVPWPIIEALQGRVDRFPPKREGGATWAGIVMDTNPPDTDSRWFKFFEEDDHSEAVAALAEHVPGLTVASFCQIFKQPSGLSANPENARNQSPGYWHRLAIGKSPEWIRVYCHGEYGFVIDGQPVFPEYHDHVHCPGLDDPKRAPTTNPAVPVQRGYDFGLTPACVFSQLTPKGTWVVVDELNATSMGVDRFSDEVLEHSARHFPDSTFEDVGDPAGEGRSQTDERTCFEIMHAKGIQITAGLQSPTIRFESVRRPLMRLDREGNAGFNIHPRCRMLRRALMGGYHFRKVQIAGTDRYAEKPEKNSYCVPMTTEALTPEGWRDPSALEVGQPIYGFDMAAQRLVTTEIQALNVFPEHHDLIAWRSNHTSFLSTAGHRNVARTRAGFMHMIETADLNGGHGLLCAASEDRPRKQRPFSDQFISLAAWVAAEGSYRRKDQAILLCQSQAHNPAYVAYLDRLVAAFPGTIRHETDSWTNPRMRTWRIVRETAWLLRHWMPDKVPSAEFVATMCNGDRRRFLYEFLRADGHAGGVLPDPGSLGRAKDFAPHDITPRIFQKRPDMVGVLQMMAALSGIRSHARLRGDNRYPGFLLTLRPTEPFFGMAGKLRSIERTAGVWCPTTATGTWICRQDGQTFVTGNSHCADALGYTATRLFGHSLRSGLRQGESVEEDSDEPTATLQDRTRSSITGY